MSKLTLLSLAFVSFSLTAQAQGPGELVQKIHDDVAAGVAQCGLKVLSGQDNRLIYQIRARNVDEVIAKVKPDGQVVPGVLVDFTANTGSNDNLSLVYSKTNGSLLMQASRTFDFNDVAIDTSRAGRVAFSNSYFRGQELYTDYVLQDRGARYVSEQEFRAYVDNTVVKGFVDFVCGQSPKQ